MHDTLPTPRSTLISPKLRRVLMVIDLPDGSSETVACDDETDGLEIVGRLVKDKAEDYTIITMFIEKGAAHLPVVRWIFMDGKAKRLWHKR